MRYFCTPVHTDRRRIHLLAALALIGAIVPGVCVHHRALAEDDALRMNPKIAAEGVLLLHTGRLVRGRILKNGDDYVVQKDQGEMFVPGSLVKFRCKDLKDAYEQQRAKIPEENSIEQHVALARWCLGQQLLGEARRELQDILQLDPTRQDARDHLQRLNDVLDPQTRPESKPRESSSEAVKSSGVKPEEIESLGGLSRDAAQEYVRRIQPIIMNNCTLAGCHGPEASNAFRLQRVIAGGDSNRHAAERNLAMVLRYVDLTNPRASQLLVVPKGNHGRRGRTVFAGTRGADQSAALARWVQDLAKAEAAKNPKSSKIAKKSARPGSAPAGAVNLSSHATDSDEDAASGVTASQSARAVVQAESDASHGSQAESELPIPVSDPFDPAIFNRGEDRKALR